MSQQIKTVCQRNMCTGCMACVDICSEKAIHVQDDLRHNNAEINQALCIKCGACHKICPQNNPPQMKSPMTWMQGWSEKVDIRSSSSSGGVATAIAQQFISKGGVVYACEFRDGEFVFSKAFQEKDVYRFQGSKYVKSNPKGVYQIIAREIKQGQKVLFIGLPCQVAAVKNFVVQADMGNLYTIDLICHGAPSPQILDIFLRQYNRSLRGINHIAFRKNSQYQLFLDNKPLIEKGTKDAYTIAFLKSLICAESCYTCRYASIQRVSDITLGDARGSDLPAAVTVEGNSLILCQTEKGKKLLENIHINRCPIDLHCAIEKNQPLSSPALKPRKRQVFFNKIKYGISFNRSVYSIYPINGLNQVIKKLLRLRVFDGRRKRKREQ